MKHKPFRPFDGESWFGILILIVIFLLFLEFILFPFVSLVSGVAVPIIIVESCSMFHSENFDESSLGSNWSFKNGLSKGDIVFVTNPRYINIGDVILFEAGQGGPILHRLVNLSLNGDYSTKGDNNLNSLDYERAITGEQIIGKASFRIPFLGWAKLIFFDWRNSFGQRGLCQ